MPRLVAILGAAGVILFVVCAVLAWVWPMVFEMSAVRIVIVYTATILSFLGGVIWGVASSALAHDPLDQEHPLLFAASVLPSLIAWGAVFLPDRVGLAVLVIAFAAVLWLDHRVARANLVPAWWLVLRRRLSLVVILSLLATAMAPGV